MSTNDSIWSTYVSAGLAAYQSGDYDRAEQDLKETLAALNNVVRGREAIRADLLHVLANVYRERDQYTDTDRFYRESIEIKEADEGPNSPGLLRIYRDFTLSLIMQGNFGDAFASERLALAIAEANATQHRFEVHRSLCRIAAITYTAGDYSQARKYYGRILEERLKTIDLSEPALRPLFADLGMVCYHVGEYEQAEEYLSQALAMGSSDDVEANALRNDLGLALCAQHKHGQAQGICRRAADGRSASQQQASEQLNDLADVFCDRNQFADARPLCESALACREEAGDDVANPLARKLQMYCNLVRRVNCCEKNDEIERRIQRLFT